MCPVFLKIGPFIIESRTFAYLVAMTLCYLVFVQFDRRQRLGIDAVKLLALCICLYHVSFWGAQLLQRLTDALNGQVYQAGNGAFYGGVIAVAFCLLGISRLWKIAYSKMLDMAALGLCIAGVPGRLGCYLAGCCIGSEASETTFFTVRYPINYIDGVSPSLLELICGQRRDEYMQLFNNSPFVYPAPLIYSVGWGLIFGLIYSRRDEVSRIPGCIFLLVLISHGCLRIFVECFRFNPPYLFWKINIAIVVSVGSVLIGTFFLITFVLQRVSGVGSRL